VGVLKLVAIADKGTSAECDGEDWIRIKNSGLAPMDLQGFILTDDKGPGHSKAFTFPSSASIAAGETKLMCKGADFAFGIGGDDTISIYDNSGIRLDYTTLGGKGGVDYVWTNNALTDAWGYVPVADFNNLLTHKLHIHSFAISFNTAPSVGPKSDSSESKGTIIGAAIGGTALLLLIACACYYVKIRKGGNYRPNVATFNNPAYEQNGGARAFLL
jgi:hypothetical protein